MEIVYHQTCCHIVTHDVVDLKKTGNMCRSNRSKNNDHRTYFIKSGNICCMFVISELVRHVDKIQYYLIRYIQKARQESDLIYRNFCVWYDPSKNSHHLSRLSCHDYVSHFKERRSTKITQEKSCPFRSYSRRVSLSLRNVLKSLEIERIYIELYVIILVLWRSARKYCCYSRNLLR